MNHRRLLFLLLCSSPIFIYCQTGYSDAGSKANAMGNASVTFQDVFSAQNNQAGIAFVEDITAGLSTQNYFLVEGGISAHHGVFVLPFKKQGALSTSVNYFGDNTFNQTQIGIGYGRKLADNVSVGIQLDYVGTKTIEVGSSSAFTFDVGVLYKPIKTFTIGAKVFNPIRAEIGGSYDEELPSIINVGIAYHPSKKIIMCAEAEQILNQDLRAKLGMEYHIFEQLFLRGGYISNPSMFTCGIGVVIKDLTLDVSSQFHQQLGFTPGLGLSYKF